MIYSFDCTVPYMLLECSAVLQHGTHPVVVSTIFRCSLNLLGHLHALSSTTFGSSINPWCVHVYICVFVCVYVY